MRNKLPQSFKRYPWLDELGLKPGAKLKLSRLLDRVYYGNKNTISHPMVERFGKDAIISKWDKIFNARRDEFIPDFVDIEISNRSKVGPRSIAVPWSEREQSVNNQYSIEKSTHFSSSVLQEVDKLTPRFRPLGASAALRSLKNNTSSGLPYLQKKGEIKDDLIANYDYLLSRKDPCVLLTRTQEMKKTRDVWGYPAADTLREMRYFRPFLEFERRLPWRTALLNPEAVDKSIDKLITESIKNNRRIASIDFPQYDATVKRNLQSATFNYIKSSFQDQFDSEIDDIAQRFATIGLVTPDGIRTGCHGVPSGSTFTNTVDSAVQHLISKHFGVSDEMKQIQGDDGVYSVDSPEDLYSHFSSFGLEVSQEKSFVSNDCAIYLQNFYSDRMRIDGQCRGIYPSYRALGRILYQERFTDFGELELQGSDFNSLRVISILENCKYHPLFSQFVRFIANLDKYGLGYSQSGIIKYVRYLMQSSGIEGIFRYRRGDEIAGLARFATVQELSKL